MTYENFKSVMAVLGATGEPVNSGGKFSLAGSGPFDLVTNRNNFNGYSSANTPKPSGPFSLVGAFQGIRIAAEGLSSDDALMYDPDRKEFTHLGQVYPGCSIYRKLWLNGGNIMTVGQNKATLFIFFIEEWE